MEENDEEKEQFWREDNDNDENNYEFDKFLKLEIANNVGHKITIATGFGETITGRIMSVKDDAVFLQDSRGDIHFIRSEMIAYARIKKTRELVKKAMRSRQKKLLKHPPKKI